MKVKVKYKQKLKALGVYGFYRIIELKPDNKIFKNKIETLLFSTFKMSEIDYQYAVRQYLSLSKERVLKTVKPIIREHMTNLNNLNEEIEGYEIELDID